MTTKLITIDTDTHVVVPRELPFDEMRNRLINGIEYAKDGGVLLYAQLWKEITDAAPQLTTPPVLRWEGEKLAFYEAELGRVEHYYLTQFYWVAYRPWSEGLAATEQLARLAAQKALGFPDWLVVDEL